MLNLDNSELTFVDITADKILELLQDVHALYVQNLDEYNTIKKYSHNCAFQYKRELDEWYREMVHTYLNAIIQLKAIEKGREE